MLDGSRRRFLAVTGAALLYGGRSAFATEAQSSARPRVALLLPLNSAAFARPADSVRQGFAVVAQQDTGSMGLDVMVYSTTDSAANVTLGYEQAIADGARLLVGPLTRNDVSAVIAHAQDQRIVTKQSWFSPPKNVIALRQAPNDAERAEYLAEFNRVVLNK